MVVLSRQSSRQSILQQEDTSKLTLFPNPEVTTATASSQGLENGHGALGSLGTLLEATGPSIFDEQHAETASAPQTLSSAPPHVLQAVLDHRGAAALTRRLATLLAERDAHITALTRLAEEYKVPAERIADARSRAKQAERRRLSLATASEDAMPLGNGQESDAGVCCLLRLTRTFVLTILLAIYSLSLRPRRRQRPATVLSGALQSFSEAWASVRLCPKCM